MRGAAHGLFAFLLAACGGGGGEGDTSGCSGNCGIATPVSLTLADVEQVVRQAVHEAQARSAPATIAVIDRVGNVLAVFTMTGAAPTFTITSGRGVSGGLENVSILPPQFPAIAKAITAAYFSSEGQAFTSRTAGQVVQENFNPGEINSPGGPLFGVQFSNLTCSDVNQLSPSVTAGPKASPLGFAADPGGLPLYKGGSVVGAVGVMSDGIYGVDLDIFDVDQNSDELIAVAGARGFDAPANRRADRITAERGLRYTDSESLASNPATAPAFAALPGVLLDVPGFFSPAAVRAGTAYGTPASGYRPATDPAFAGLNAFVLDDGTGTQRFPPVAGTDGLLTQAEVTTLLAEGIRVANRTRSQIRQPLGSAAQVTVTVVDTNGAIVGLLRTPDALVDSTDVTPLKARTALLFSHPNTAADLAAAPPANYLSPPAQSPISTYVSNIQALIPGALSNGIAYSSRAVGNLARPFLPDGINGTGPGPLAKPFASWSVFSTGLSLDLVHDRLVANLLSPPGPAPGAPPVPGAGNCTTLARARTGILLFPGGFPIFRGATLVGAIAASGDGSDQSDLIAFLGLANAGRVLGTGIAHAPAARRTDTISVPGGRLRYVGCPFAPLLDTTASNVCDGI